MRNRFILILIWILISSMTTGIVYVQVEQPLDMESSKKRSKVIKKSLEAPMEDITQTLYALLLGMDVPVEKVDEEGKIYLRILQSWVAGDDKEFGEFFDYKKKGEDALFWDFNEESLEAGRQGHLATYIKMPGSSLIGGAGKMKKPNAAPLVKIKNAYLVGRVDFKSASRTKTKILFETLYFVHETEKEFTAQKSTGKFEKEMIKLTEDILTLESRVFPVAPDSLKKVLAGVIKKYEMVIDVDVDQGFMTGRLFMDREGDYTGGKFAKRKKQLMGLWQGTYRAVFLMNPEGEELTRVKPVFVFMAINGNNGKRKWEVYPTKWVMEEDILSDLRNAFLEE